MEYWHAWAIEKSENLLKKLKGEIDFILIGGWAVYYITKTLKSRDIDLIVDFQGLRQLKYMYNISKNPHLKKYEAKVEGVSIDIYVKYYSQFPLPISQIEKTIVIEGFKIPKPEVLLILKQQAEIARKSSLKGRKDRVDILALLVKEAVSIKDYLRIVKKHGLEEYWRRLIEIVSKSTVEYKHLGITRPGDIRKIKSRIIEQLKSPV